MKKLLIPLLLLATNTVNANIECPTPATIKANTNFTINTVARNLQCGTSMNINRTVIAFVGNSGSNSVGLLGPFVKRIAEVDIPGPNCTDTWETDHSFTITSPKKIPTSLIGTLVTVSTGVLDTEGKLTLIEGSCLLEVIK